MTLYNKSGVYVIENLVNGKFYIGSSKNLGARRLSHFNNLRHNRHHSTHLQYSFNKHGREAFKFFVLDFCNEEDRLKIEQKWLDIFFEDLKCCNILPSTECPKPTLGKRWTKEQKEKHRKSALNRKFKHSPETVEKMRQRMLDPKKNPMSNPDYRKKISNKLGALTHEICKCVADQYRNTKVTQMQLSEKYNVDRSCIRRCLRLYY